MITLNGQWKMKSKDENEWHKGTVPGTVYTDLLETHLIADPYVGENEDEVRDISYQDYIYEREFEISEETLQNQKNILVCKGIDTIADILINEKLIGKCENMHRKYEFDISDTLKKGNNKIEVLFHSPLKYMQKLYERKPLWGVTSTISGYQYIRKAHCMFGWDWGPQLPDMGIWRDIYIEEINEARIISTYVRQNNQKDHSVLTIEVENEIADNNQLELECRVYDPDRKLIFSSVAAAEEKQFFRVDIEQPQLWWPNGYGKQNLYKLRLSIKKGTDVLSEREENIGIRDLTVVRRKDQWGAGFTFCINGIEIFAKGANYIPEDSIIGRCNKQRTQRLLSDCKRSNFNCIRVWGGGYYPDDYFFDLCDESGLIVWEDFMFACAVYDLTEAFYENIKEEIKDNIIRLRNHPSLGMWCGNNEMEGAWVGWGIPQNQKLKQDYLTMFERLIPEMLEKYDPDRFYWPASPSSEGGFENPFDEGRGDAHYWEVWHGKKPFEDIESKYFRFLSEYGFEAIPSMKTLRTVISEDQFNIVSPEMEKHQKCTDNGPGNVTLMYYLLSYYQCPKNFEMNVYTTQSLQADFLEMAVRHFRSHRERCSGSTYWQVNDIYPTISWATIDYYGRWKGAHYVVKRSYGQIISYVEIGEDKTAGLYISSDNTEEVKVTYKIELIEQGKESLYIEQEEITVMPQASVKVTEFKIPELDDLRKRNCYIHYEVNIGDKCVDSANRLLEKPKKFNFVDPELEVTVQEEDGKTGITVKSHHFARRVGIDFLKTDVILSDNYFDLLPQESKTVWVEDIRSVENVDIDTLRSEIFIISNYDI